MTASAPQSVTAARPDSPKAVTGLPTSHPRSHGHPGLRHPGLANQRSKSHPGVRPYGGGMTTSSAPEPVPVPTRVLLPGDQEVVAHLWSRRQAPNGWRYEVGLPAYRNEPERPLRLLYLAIGMRCPRPMARGEPVDTVYVRDAEVENGRDRDHYGAGQQDGLAVPHPGASTLKMLTAWSERGSLAVPPARYAGSPVGHPPRSRWAARKEFLERLRGPATTARPRRHAQALVKGHGRATGSLRLRRRATRASPPAHNNILVGR